MFIIYCHSFHCYAQGHATAQACNWLKCLKQQVAMKKLRNWVGHKETEETKLFVDGGDEDETKLLFW